MALLTGGAVSAGCARSALSRTTPPPPSVTHIGHMVGHDDLRPEAAPPARASLLYQQLSAIPVRVKTLRRGGHFTVNLYAHDELFDYEEYIAEPEVFAIVHGAGEDYDPPIPILKFPLNLGGPGWTWTGTLSSEQNPHPASATITTVTDTVTIGVHAVRADVDMIIAPHGDASTTERRMSFWFEAGHGLIKTDFAGTSIRQPLMP